VKSEDDEIDDAFEGVKDGKGNADDDVRVEDDNEE
jgi:hypothetical protein